MLYHRKEVVTSAGVKFAQTFKDEGFRNAYIESIVSGNLPLIRTLRRYRQYGYDFL